MAIATDTELIHEQLGSIRYDNGKHDPQVAGMRDTTPKWVCRPDGWDASGFEIYLPGTADEPSHLAQALVQLGVDTYGDKSLQLPEWIGQITYGTIYAEIY